MFCYLQGYEGPDSLGEALKGCDLVIIPAGVPRKPGMTRDDLFKVSQPCVCACVRVRVCVCVCVAGWLRGDLLEELGPGVQGSYTPRAGRARSPQAAAPTHGARGSAGRPPSTAPGQRRAGPGHDCAACNGLL